MRKETAPVGTLFLRSGRMHCHAFSKAGIELENPLSARALPERATNIKHRRIVGNGRLEFHGDELRVLPSAKAAQDGMPAHVLMGRAPLVNAKGWTS